ncbi:MAG: hypothetical protein IIC52_05700 [Proteobacteria bacterium]|nr:hypothetical protein [Pseudomonadota bacterium]
MTPMPPAGDARSETIARLRTEIARIEAAGATGGPGTTAPGPVTFGIAAIDGHLPGGGLAPGAVHEIIAGDDGMAATGLALALAARLFAMAGRRSWFWCGQGLPLYGPGLAAFGFDAGAGLMTRGGSDREVLWAMEEGLACGAFAAVFGEVKTFAPHAGRRLALAARDSGGTAFVLRGRGAEGAPSVAATRWRVRSVPLAPGALPGATDSPADSPPDSQSADGEGYAWRLDLLRGGGAMPRSWRVLWRPGRAAPPFPAACEDWPQDHGCEDQTGAPPGALSLAPPLSGGTVPQGERILQREAGPRRETG